MRFNPFKSTPETPVLLAITPPRNAERTVLGVENLLGSIAVPEPFSLELCGDADGVTLMARCLDQEVVRQQLSAHYPQARIHQLEPADDPLFLAEGEQAWQLRLRASGPEYVPLRVFRDDDLLDPGSDPLIALLGALSSLRPGERVVTRRCCARSAPTGRRATRSGRTARPCRRRASPPPSARCASTAPTAWPWPPWPWAVSPSSRATSGGRRARPGKRSRSSPALPSGWAWRAGPGRAGTARATASTTRS